MQCKVKDYSNIQKLILESYVRARWLVLIMTVHTTACGSVGGIVLVCHRLLYGCSTDLISFLRDEQLTLSHHVYHSL